jgi:pimeloyl-ACP methyl ester carboxylesterase
MEIAYKQRGLDLRIIPHAQRDLVRSWLGLSAHKIPVVGKPGDVALMTTPGAMEAFEQMAPADYVNETCARIAIRGDKYRPVNHAGEVQCPTLLQFGENDDLIPIGAVEKTAEILGDLAEVKRYPIGHFDIYTGGPYETSVADQTAFFKKHLL